MISSILSCPNSTTLVNLIAGNDTCKYEGEYFRLSSDHVALFGGNIVDKIFPGYKVRDSIKQVVSYMKNFDDYTWIHNLEVSLQLMHSWIYSCSEWMVR